MPYPAGLADARQFHDARHVRSHLRISVGQSLSTGSQLLSGAAGVSRRSVWPAVRTFELGGELEVAGLLRRGAADIRRGQANDFEFAVIVRPYRAAGSSGAVVKLRQEVQDHRAGGRDGIRRRSEASPGLRD